MDQRQFEPILEIKISDLVALVIHHQNVSFEEALLFVYESELYTFLTNETTKLWHLSTTKLFDMLLDEKKEKQLTFPDNV